MSEMHHQFIFIVGLHRSGTTLLFRILRDHPAISGFYIPHGAEREHEGQHLQTVYPPDTELGGPGYFAFNPESHLSEISDLVSEANRTRLYTEWSRHWDLSRPILLEKSPQNLVQTRFLQAMFLDSCFISILRHPVATSLATLKWMGWPRYVIEPQRGCKHPSGDYSVRVAKKDDVRLFHQSKRLFTESMLYTLLKHWIVAHQCFIGDAGFLKRKLVLRYEDLVAGSARTLKDVYTFLSVPAIDLLEGQAITNYNQKYFDKWNSLPKNELSPDGRRFLINSFEGDVSQYGYSLANVGTLGENNFDEKFNKYSKGIPQETVI